MGQANLRVIENKAMDKSKALDAALSQIERAFGKGSVMKLGAESPQAPLVSI
jgi:recombination protein RecA